MAIAELTAERKPSASRLQASTGSYRYNVQRLHPPALDRVLPPLPESLSSHLGRRVGFAQALWQQRAGLVPCRNLTQNRTNSALTTVDGGEFSRILRENHACSRNCWHAPTVSCRTYSRFPKTCQSGNSGMSCKEFDYKGRWLSGCQVIRFSSYQVRRFLGSEVLDLQLRFQNS